jgi:hypothetical protein
MLFSSAFRVGLSTLRLKFSFGPPRAKNVLSHRDWQAATSSDAANLNTLALPVPLHWPSRDSDSDSESFMIVILEPEIAV